MLTAVVCGLLCGQRGYTALIEWPHDLPVDVWHWMGYTRRPPKEDCFLLVELDSAALELTLRTWITQVLQPQIPTEEELAGVSLDRKSLCGTLTPFARAVHLLAAGDHQTNYVLSQMRVDAKTNEHKAALELLPTMVVKGRVVGGEAQRRG